MKYFLGVDGGGTKTEAVLVDEKGEVVAQSRAGGTNANVLGMDRAMINLSTAILKAVGEKRQIIGTFAIAGIDTDQDEIKWNNIFKKDSQLANFFAKVPVFINDIKASLRSGTLDKNAVAFIAGTGSSCSGQNEGGDEAKSGGQDYILSDEGSSYFIGDRILKAITKSLDGRGPKTVLTDLLFEKFQIDSLSGLHSLVYEKPWDKTDIASVAPLISKAVKKNDQAALKIINDAVYELGIMGKAVVEKLKLKDKPYTVVFSGSTFNIRDIREMLKQELLAFSPKAKFVRPEMSSAKAAAFLALEDN